MPSQLSRIALALCLASAGSSLLASQAPHTRPGRVPAPAPQTEPAGPLGWLWNQLITVWDAAGCGLDPDGVKCSSSLAPGGYATAVPPAPAGCGIDPDGHS